MKKKNFPKNNISFKKVNKKSKDLTPLGSFWTAFNYGNSLLIKYSPCFLKAFIRINSFALGLHEHFEYIVG